MTRSSWIPWPSGAPGIALALAAVVALAQGLHFSRLQASRQQVRQALTDTLAEASGGGTARAEND